MKQKKNDMAETYNERALRAAGFTLVDDSDVWFNLGLRKGVLPRGYTPPALRESIKEPVPLGEFYFYSASVPVSDEAGREILTQLGITNLRPIPRGGPRSS